jgi:hypothetical protein
MNPLGRGRSVVRRKKIPPIFLTTNNFVGKSIERRNIAISWESL